MSTPYFSFISVHLTELQHYMYIGILVQELNVWRDIGAIKFSNPTGTLNIGIGT